MKELAAFVLLVVLIFIGWKQPFKAHFISVIGEPAAMAAPAQTAPRQPPGAAAVPSPVQVSQATPAPDNSWLWKKTTMDPPSRSGKEGKK